MNAPVKVDVRRILASIIADYEWQADRADPEMKPWILAKKAEAEKADAAVAELIEATARLSAEIEFRIDDPRAQMLDRVRRAVTGAVGCDCPARAKAGYISHAPNCPARAALARVQGGAE